jgi:DNA-binding CsgD family transcriptional regulator
MVGPFSRLREGGPTLLHQPYWLPGRAADPLSDLTRHSEREAHTEKSNAEIARTLYLVEVTVKAHVSSILIKLDARNRVQAAILAYEAGLA